jgi:DNA-binding MarR family transcriptional regulator
MVTGGNITGLANQLERDGLLVRERSPNDRRNVLLKLTRKGRKRFAAMAREHELWVVTLLSPLTPAEQGTLRELLGKLKVGLRSDNATGGSKTGRPPTFAGRTPKPPLGK